MNHYLRALDAILDSLIRRYERRVREADNALGAVIDYRKKNGGKDDRGLLTNYHEAHGRAEEARLAMNQAIAQDAAARQLAGERE